jgi:hypothetical protein
MAKITFTIEGLAHGGAPSTDAYEEVLRALADRGFGQPRFDPASQTFSVELDPAVDTFSDVRRTVSVVGKSRDRVYIAVVMSP